VPRIKAPLRPTMRARRYRHWILRLRHSHNRARPAARTTGIEPMRPWVLHDLLRSVATGMAEMGVARRISSRGRAEPRQR
jgi:hypothetical protein